MFSNGRFWDELAIQSYREILKNKPDSALVHSNLGLAYVRIGRLNKAVRSFQRAIKCDKTFAEAHYHLGRAYQDLGKTTEAIRAFKNYSKHSDGDKKSIVPALLEHLKEERAQE